MIDFTKAQRLAWGARYQSNPSPVDLASQLASAGLARIEGEDAGLEKADLTQGKAKQILKQKSQAPESPEEEERMEAEKEARDEGKPPPLPGVKKSGVDALADYGKRYAAAIRQAGGEIAAQMGEEDLDPLQPEDGLYLAKGGPFIGPRGGKWADAKHTIPYDEKKHGKGAKQAKKKKKAVPKKTHASLVDAADMIRDYEKEFGTSRLNKFIFGVGIPDFRSMLAAAKVMGGRGDSRLHVDKKQARAFLKPLRSALKDVGKYGGAPAKLQAEKRALQDVADELKYAIKNPEPSLQAMRDYATVLSKEYGEALGRALASDEPTIVTEGYGKAAMAANDVRGLMRDLGKTAEAVEWAGRATSALQARTKIQQAVAMADSPRQVSAELGELDALADKLNDPNLIGFLRRIPGSKHHRAPPAGSLPAIPDLREIRGNLDAARMHAARQKDPAKWFEAKGEAHKEAVFTAMRKIGAEVDAGYARAQQMSGTGGDIPVGAAHYDEFLSADSRNNVLSGVRQGMTPQAAGERAKLLARESIAKHNAQRPDHSWQRWEGAGDYGVELTVRRLTRASEAVTPKAHESDPGDRAGMEGPFTYAGGRTLYYDPKEAGGRYYDPKLDHYLTHEEAAVATSSYTHTEQEAGRKVADQAEKKRQEAAPLLDQMKLFGKGGQLTDITDWIQKIGEIDMVKAKDKSPGESLSETGIEELTQTHADLVARLKSKPGDAAALQKRCEVIAAELKKRAGKTNLAEKGCDTPGKKIRSKGQGRGEARGGGKGPIGRTDLSKGGVSKKAGQSMMDWMTENNYKAFKKSEVNDMSGIGKLAEYGQDLEDLEKALPEGNPKQKLGQGSEQGGKLAGVGETSGSNTSGGGPGQDAQGQITGTKTSKKKLSEDDEEDEGQMKPHKKPIEMARKSHAIPQGQREQVAHEHAQKVSQLRKGAAEEIEPANGEPAKIEPAPELEKGRVGRQGMVQYSEQSDIEAAALLKSEKFYTGGSPQVIPFSRPIGVGKVCPQCKTALSKSLSACPSCGLGTVVHRVVPGGEAQGDHDGTPIVKSRAGKLRPRIEQDVKIG